MTMLLSKVSVTNIVKMVITICDEISMHPTGKGVDVISNSKRNFRILPVLAATTHQGQIGRGKTD